MGNYESKNLFKEKNFLGIFPHLTKNQRFSEASNP